jgi:hypothetical protein
MLNFKKKQKLARKVIFSPLVSMGLIYFFALGFPLCLREKAKKGGLGRILKTV